MPTTVQIVNRYVHGEYVASAAVVFDGAAIDAKSPRTQAHGQVVVATETLSDGNHVMNIVPDQTSADPVGPAVAEGLGKTVTRMYRSLDVNVTVSKGKITTVTLPPAQAPNGAVLAGVNPVRVQLQPVYFRSQYQKENFRQGTDITLIVVHQTAKAANIAGTLGQFTIPNLGDDGTSSHYVISPEAIPQVVKVVQDTGRASHAGPSSWQGKSSLNDFSIGIELSHKTGTPFPAKQIDCLIDLIGRLRAAYPTIPADGVVGHSDVLLEKNDPSVLAGRDCPGFDFDWPALESSGLGLIPRGGAPNLDMYGGFFRVATAPHNSLIAGDSDESRTWGGKKWPAPAPPPASDAPPPPPGAPPAKPAPPTVSGTPITELQTDLRDIGYIVPVHGHYEHKTRVAIQMFQHHFFAGSRRSLVHAKEGLEVNQVTAEFIKRVR
ncbi:MAG: N-acetylmuramoyl-L-alanine amidase [Roseiarcus sp.]